MNKASCALVVLVIAASWPVERAAAQADDTRTRLGQALTLHASFDKDLNAGHVDFHVSDRKSPQVLSVRYLGIDVPDLFKDGAEVVVEPGRQSWGGYAATVADPDGHLWMITAALRT